jgi:hypothetical protein
VVHPRPQAEVKITLIATGVPGTEYVAPRDSPEPRERRLPPRPTWNRDDEPDREYDRPRERDWDREDLPLAEPPDPDDLDLPAFLRRRRQR